MPPFGAHHITFEAAEFVDIEDDVGAGPGNEVGGNSGAAGRQIHDPGRLFTLLRGHKKFARKIDLNPQMPAALGRSSGDYRLTIHDHANLPDRAGPASRRIGSHICSHEKVNKALANGSWRKGT